MLLIYGQAERVIVWLGLPAAHAEELFKVINANWTSKNETKRDVGEMRNGAKAIPRILPSKRKKNGMEDWELFPESQFFIWISDLDLLCNQISADFDTQKSTIRWLVSRPSQPSIGIVYGKCEV